LTSPTGKNAFQDFTSAKICCGALRLDDIINKSGKLKINMKKIARMY
jgi:hypothetical protein